MNNWSLLEKHQQPTPYLEELCLWGIFPATFFSGKAPRLRGLWLQSCSFDEDLPYLSQLIHLRMLHLSGMRNSLSTKWLDILASK
jgi:hypothetical protein